VLEAALLQQERVPRQEGRSRGAQRRAGTLPHGAFVEPSKLTVEAFLLEQWLPAVQGRLRAASRANYQTNLQVHIIPAMGGLKLQRLTVPRIASFYSELLTSGRRDGKGLSPKTVRNIHALLHRALKDAAHWGYVPTTERMMSIRPAASTLHWVQTLAR
jgi:integrase